MLASGGARQSVRAFAAVAITLMRNSSCGVVTRAGIVTDVQGQFAQIAEQPHGTPSGQASRRSSWQPSCVSSAFATDITPLAVSSKATTSNA